MTKRDPDFLVRSLEPLNGGPTPSRQVASFLTPNELFFVRNHGSVPRVDANAYRLAVGGMVATQLDLSLADLAERFERRTVISTLACAGQRRIEMTDVAPIPGELPWGQEAVSTAEWSGWSLADVLRAAGVTDDAQHVAFEGLDEVERRGERFKYGSSIPRSKAASHEVLLADSMNGQPLPPEHGYPLRVVVPGYIGARQVKWLRRIEARPTSSDNYFQAVAYRRYPRDMTHETHDPTRGVELTELEVNCLIAAPAAGAAVGSGPVQVKGVAYAGGDASVAKVEVSGDGGESWVSARLEPPVASPGVATAPTLHDERSASPGASAARWAWRIFTCELEVAFNALGVGVIAARAHDSLGATQPRDAEGLWNFKGYMNNAWPRVHVVRVR